jgi:hypothetical protein
LVDNQLLTLFEDRLVIMRSLKIALIWMLMLALPAQSMAAISMQLCAVTQSSGSAAQIDPQMAAHHPGAMRMSQSAGADHAAHHASRVDSSDTGAPTADNSLCSLCAFCVGAVTLSSLTSSASPLHAIEPSMARLNQFVGFIAETPERPPRLFLA